MSSATSTADRRGQQLPHPNACWMRSHHQVLDSHLPEPGATWRWSATGLSRSILSDLRNRGLIEKCDGEWVTKRRAWDALERYGTADAGERGEIVGQQALDAYVEEAKEARGDDD